MAFNLQTFTLFHVLLSLAGIVSGLVVAGGLASGRRLADWSAIFIVMTAATDVTGFGFPAARFCRRTSSASSRWWWPSSLSRR